MPATFKTMTDKSAKAAAKSIVKEDTKARQKEFGRRQNPYPNAHRNWSNVRKRLNDNRRVITGALVEDITKSSKYAEDRVATFEADKWKDLKDNNKITSSTNTSTCRWRRDYNHQSKNGRGGGRRAGRGGRAAVAIRIAASKTETKEGVSLVKTPR